ncbi:MAG: amino acid permease [Planctomycetaceae bacterium]
MTDPESPSDSRRVLSLWDAVSLILGMVIGTSIFRSPSLIFSNMPGVGSTLLLWAAGGVLSLIGAFCYAELAAAWPERGGDVTYLSRAFGNWLGYLLGWCRMLVIFPANVGIMSFAFQDYLIQALNLDARFSPWISLSAVLVMTVINLAGVQSGRRAQNALTLSKLCGFALVIFAGQLIASKGNWPAMSNPLTNGHVPNPGLALVFVLYSFGGWNDAVYLAAELKNPQRDLPRALAGGVFAVLVVYLAVNLSYAMLGIDQLRTAAVPARDLTIQAFGAFGGVLVAGLLMISALGAMHGTIFGGSRLTVAMGEQYSTLRGLVSWSDRGAPTRAIGLVSFSTVLLVLGIETQTGRDLIDRTTKLFGESKAIPWDRFGGGFDTLLAATAPLFWVFFFLSGVALIVLRVREPNTPRPFRTPFYPLTPLLFMATSAYMLYSSVMYVQWLALLSLLPVVPGLVAWQFERRERRAGSPS